MKQPTAHMPPRPLPTLGEAAMASSSKLLQQGRATAFPHYWQVPAATERAAWEAVRGAAASLPFEYWAFPWATVIDGLRGEAAATWSVLAALRQAIAAAPCAAPGLRRVSVAQHIHALQFVDLFKAAGITDLFWSHATHGQPEVEGIRLHAFPLFPAQTPNLMPPAEPVSQRKHLANFIGAYNPKIYLTNVREVIFNDPNERGDLLIIKRDAWHFDRAVYDEQVKGMAPDQQRIKIEKQMTVEYLDAIRDSWFTLCPSGSGPNSIRIFESLCLGSIPIILTRDLRLPGTARLWSEAALIADDSAQGYVDSIKRARAMPNSERMARVRSGARLLSTVTPTNYAEIMRTALGR